MSKRPPKAAKRQITPEVLRRSPAERKRLPADLEAFAAGDDDAIWRRPQKRRLDDPRPVALVPGVANRDARLVYEARERRLRRALEAGDQDAAALELAEARQLRVWRGHSIVGFDVFVENVLGMAPAEVEALLRRADELGLASEVPTDDVVATWMRAEAGLLEACPDAVVRLRGHGDGARLVLEVPVADAAAALAGAGRREAPLARHHAEQPKDIVDRPKGIPRISRLEREAERS